MARWLTAGCPEQDLMKIRSRSVHEQNHAPSVESCTIVRQVPSKMGAFNLRCGLAQLLKTVLASAGALVRGVELHEVEVQGSAAAVSFWRLSFQVVLRKDCRKENTAACDTSA